jgi:tetratricopeptide (TPR) repeat protein
MDTSSTLEEKAVALYKSKNTDQAIAELRRALADAPDLPDEPQIAVVLRRITAHRTLAAWLAERASKGGMLETSDQEEGTRLYESALKLLDSVFPEGEEEPIEENPDFKPKEQSLADALKMEITRVRFALLLQLVRLHAVVGKEDQDKLEEHGRRLFDSDFIAKAEKMGAAAPTEEFTDARKAWRASLLRVGAEAFTKVGSDEAAQRWRDVLDLCRSRERDVHMQMGIARPTAEMRGQTVEALVGLAAALHPPWNHLPAGVVAADGSHDRQRFEAALDEIETSLRDALEIIEQVGDAEMVASNTLSSVMLARTLRMPVVSAEGRTAGTGVSFLTNYPARAREFAKLMHDGLLSATSGLGEIPAVPAEAFSGGSAGADAQLSRGLNEEEEDFGDQRDWKQLNAEEQSAAQRLGWSAKTWDDGEWLDEDSTQSCVSWDALTAGSRADAELLGFDKREWDLCYYADEHEEAEDQQNARAAEEGPPASAEWAALHGVVASTAALTSLPAAHRRAIEVAIDCALEQLLVVAAEIAEEAAERYALQLSRVGFAGCACPLCFRSQQYCSG